MDRKDEVRAAFERKWSTSRWEANACEAEKVMALEFYQAGLSTQQPATGDRQEVIAWAEKWAAIHEATGGPDSATMFRSAAAMLRAGAVPDEPLPVFSEGEWTWSGGGTFTASELDEAAWQAYRDKAAPTPGQGKGK